MKRVIFLKIDLTQIPDSLSKAKFIVKEKELIEQAVKEFKREIKSSQIKVLKDYLPNAQVLIEFPDDQYQVIYEVLCKIDIVETIDVFLPKGET